MSDIADSHHPVHRPAPGRVLTMTIIGIFLAEVVAMLLIDSFKPLPFAWQILLDALDLVVLIFPLLYFLSFKPLLSQLAEGERNDQ